MTAIPFPISSEPGLKPQEGAGRLFNCFAIKTELGARASVKWQRCAGLLELLDITGHTHMRGAFYTASGLIVVMDERVYIVTESAGTYSATNLGALAGTLPVTIAANSAGTPNIACVTENGAFNLFVGSAPTSFADLDLPEPNSVSVLNNYLLFTIGDGRIFATGVNDVSIASNSYTTAQSRPGGLLRGVAYRSEFFAFGPNGIDVYRDTASSPFPLSFNTFIPRGLVGQFAVAGWEPGWQNDLIWAADDFGVYRLDGYTPVPIAKEAVSRDIEGAVKAGDGNLLEASVYMQGLHAFWRLTYPGNWTWEYNKTTGNWHERESYNRDDCRGSTTVKAFDRWVSGDRETGTLFEISETTYTERLDPLAFRMRSGVGAAFPARLKIPRIDLDITAAVGVSGGSTTQIDPTVLIRWSQDGGYSFGDWVQRKIGKEGEGDKRVTVQRGPLTGPKGIVLELEVTDPVHVAVMGGQYPIQMRAA
jgi:hypothetical protein